MNVSRSGWVCSWKNAQEMFFAVPWVRLRFKSDYPQWLCLYSSKWWQSISWYNLQKELNGIKDFLVKKQFLLYWIRHRYQAKTCVEHIQQDKSLINPTNSSINLLYFLHVRVICFQYCKKRMRKSNQENFNFFGRIYGHVMFSDNGNRF